jgi:glucose-1-phosphate cytidylyltransferase
MRYYAHYGHTEFILCLGYGGQAIKDYFLHYEETTSNDFVLNARDGSVKLLSSDLADWTITFVDTGMNSSIGERLFRVREHLASEEIFLANYGDVLTDAHLPDLVRRTLDSGATAGLLAARPEASFHAVQIDDNGQVRGLLAAGDVDLWINGGFFVLRSEIFSHLWYGVDLVDGVFTKLIAEDKLYAYRHVGFWAPTDTLKDRLRLETLYHSGTRPWAVWEAGERGEHRRDVPDRRQRARRSTVRPDTAQ